jgi:putative transposase
VQNTHVRRYHEHYHGSGHIWQGRFQSFPIEQDEHLLAVLRYVERNPVRANLVRRAEQWAWSSARFWIKGAKVDSRPSFLASGPTPFPRDWLAWVNAAVTANELEALRRSVTRGSPYGGPRWMARIAADLGIQSTLRPRGRPRSKGVK